MSTDHLTAFDVYPVLGRLPGRLRARVRDELRPFRAADEQQLFGVGDSCSGVPLITRGSVRVLKPLPAGRVLPLDRVAPGELCVLSVCGLLSDVVYPAAGKATGDVVGATLPKALFRTLVDEAIFRNEVFAGFAARLWLLMALIEEMAITRLDERLADLLVARGPVIRATHQALADELGTAREVVSRILEHFEADGLVRLRRAHVEVLKPQRLAQAYAGDGAAGMSSPLDGRDV
jgi:CRP/FNR family transcriptional regulator